jgi:hypothetical protein
VGTDDSIDFMSFPHFDSPTVFAALLDHQKGGHCRVAPVLEDARAPYRVEQRDGEIVFVSQGPDKTALRLRTPIPVRVENGAAIDADDVFCRPYRPALAVYHASDSRGPGG